MKANNFFISKATKNMLAANAAEFLPVEIRSKYFNLKNKYGISFDRTTRDNMQLLWQFGVSQQDNLAPDNPWRLNLISINDWQNRKSDVKHILAYLNHAGLMSDYYYLSNWNTKPLEYFVSYTLPEFGIRVSKRDLLECQDFDKFFSQYLIENCDSKTLDATKKTKETFDKLLKGLNPDERTALVNLLHAYSFSDMEFSTLHKLMNS